MRILFLSDDFPPESFGGAGIVAFRDAAALAKRGHEVAVITTKQRTGGQDDIDGTFEVEIYEDLKIYRINSNISERWRAYKSLNNKPVVEEVTAIIAEFKPDIVHAHNIHAHISYASLKVAKESGAKVFMTFHDAMAVHYGKVFPSKKYSIAYSMAYTISAFEQLRQYRFRYNPLRNIITRRYLRYADGLFAVSGALKRVLEANGINDIKVLHNGIDTAGWRTNQSSVSEFKATHGLEGKKVILYGGRLSAAKGSYATLKAFKIVSDKLNNAVLLVVGTADSSGALDMKKRAEAQGIADRIIFTGWLGPEDMKLAFASADIVAVLSLYLDPFPTINLEAMACGKPVVGTMFGGTPEIVMDGKTGYIVDPRDEASVAEKIASLLEDPEKAGRFGVAGCERVKKEFNLEAHIDTLLACYNA
jgi:glycosyltransferase involved in cell wall biosynthesis